jgi:hypothetical protein
MILGSVTGRDVPVGVNGIGPLEKDSMNTYMNLDNILCVYIVSSMHQQVFSGTILSIERPKEGARSLH